jgi:hypothetical protein
MKNRGFALPKHGVLTGNSKISAPGARHADPRIPHEFVQPNKQDREERKEHKEEPLQPDISNWYTRQQAADTLGVSVTTIATYERQGKIHSRQAYRDDGRGIEHRVAVYDPAELNTLPRLGARTAAPSPGEIAAQSFELFNGGKTERDVVVALRILPALAEQLYESWQRAGSMHELIITTEARKNFEELVGPFTSIDELYQRLQELLKPTESPAAP